LVKKTETKKTKSDLKGKSKTVKKTDVKKNTSSEDISSKTITSKKGRNKFLFIIPIIIIICIIAIVLFVVMSPQVVKAQLIIESGDVQVKHEGGSWSTAENGMLLYQSDIVKTGDNTTSSIILFESSIIRLDSNTEVMLKKIIQEADKTSVTIQQDAGRTWNTVLKVSGIDVFRKLIKLVLLFSRMLVGHGTQFLRSVVLMIMKFRLLQLLQVFVVHHLMFIFNRII